MSRKSSGSDGGIIILLIVALFGAVFKGLGAIFNSIQKVQEKKKIEEDNNKIIEDKYGVRMIDQNKSLFERNLDIINRNIGDLRTDSWPYYIENKVRDCLIDITIAEGKKEFTPGSGEYLRNWSTKQNLPKEWLDLKDNLLKQFKLRFDELKEEQKLKQKIAEEEYQKQKEKETESFLESKKDLVNKFLEITERKVSIIDDYGDESWDALPKEIESFIKKLAKIDGINEESIKEFLKKGYGWKLPEHYQELPIVLEKAFKNYHSIRKTHKTTDINLNDLSGVEFEIYLSRIFKDTGYDVSGTPTTGDQGADLIAKKNGKTLVIQAKRYQGSVGNKAVQEVVSAVNFYNGSEGWVITNSIFTPSAKALAQKNSIKLIDGHDLIKIKQLLNG